MDRIYICQDIVMALILPLDPNIDCFEMYEGRSKEWSYIQISLSLLSIISISKNPVGKKGLLLYVVIWRKRRRVEKVIKVVEIIN